MAIVDIAIDQSITYCRDNSIPEPNKDLWEGFGRPCMNRALWHYCPDSIEPDLPILNLLIGIGGLGLCFAPPLIYIIKGKLEDQTEESNPDEDTENQTEETDKETLTYELPEDNLPPAVPPKRVSIGGEE